MVVWKKNRSQSTDSGEAEVLACPSCARRYPLDQRFCSSCGMPLVYVGRASHDPPTPARERARKIHPSYAQGELVRVAGGQNQAEAEMIENLLIEQGVPSVLRRTQGFDVPDFLAGGPRDVLVPESGVEMAREILVDAGLAPAEQRDADPLTSSGVLRLLAAISAGALATAGIAWALLQLVG